MGGATRLVNGHRSIRRRSGSRLLTPVGIVAVVVMLALLALALALTVGGWDSPPTASVPGPTPRTVVALHESLPTSPESASRAIRSRDGAVQAAAWYATVLARLFPLDLKHARAVMAEAASDDARERLTAAVEVNLRPLQEQSTAIEGSTTYREAVLATRVDAYTAEPPATAGDARQAAASAPARARVRVWTLLTVSQTPAPGVQDATNAIGTFATVSLSLVWERGAWRIDDSTTLDGPAPLIDGTPSTGAQLDSALRGFTDWRPE